MVKERTFLWLLLIIILSGLVKIHIIHTPRDFWHDEAFQYLYSEKPFKEILAPNDVHPPLFNIFTGILLRVMKDIDTLRFMIVLLSLFFLLAFFYLVYYLFKREDIALLSTLFIAFSPTFLYYSTEFRNYMFTFILVIIQIYYFNKMLKEETHHYHFILLSVLCLLSHYLTALIIITQLIYILYIKNYKHINVFLMLGAPCIPIVFYMLLTIQKIQFFWFEPVTLSKFLTTFPYMISYPTLLNLGLPILAFGSMFLFLLFVKKVNNTHKQLLFYIFIPPSIGFILYPVLNFYHHRFFLFGAFGLFIFMALYSVNIKNKILTVAITSSYIILVIISLAMFPQEFNTELYDSQKYLKHNLDTINVVFVHTSTFSQSPYKVYFPVNEHYLITNLTRRQLFTAGGSVVNDWELTEGYKSRDNVWFVSDKLMKNNIIFEKGGLFVTKD